MGKKHKTLKTKSILCITFISLSVFFLSSCTSLTCRTDACYDRQLANLDPFEHGEIAAWGSEKEQAEKERKQENRLNRKQYTEKE